MSKRHICKRKFHNYYHFLSKSQKKKLYQPFSSKYPEITNWNKKWHKFYFPTFFYHVQNRTPICDIWGDPYICWDRFWSISSTEKFMISWKSQKKMLSIDISLYNWGLVEIGIKTSSIWRILGANLEANSSVFWICLSSLEMPRLLLRHIYVFSICLGKKNAEAIEFLGLLKNTFPRIKKNWFKKKKYFA